MPRYRLYGLVVDSELVLPAAEAQGEAPDLSVVCGPARPVPPSSPPGELIADAWTGPERRYYLVRTTEGYLLRFPHVCDAEIGLDLATVRLFPATDEHRPLLSILFSGNVLAMLLALLGAGTLHASGVAVNGVALAFVGYPGAGKSTLAALMCAAGATLLTDDVLRIVPDGKTLWCPSGTRTIRLRPAAAELASAVRGQSRDEPDAKTGVLVDEIEDGAALKAIVFPRPSRTATTLTTTRLTPGETMMELTRYPRTLGWIGATILENSFRWNGVLARTIPAYLAEIPWGPPFDPELASGIRALLDQP